MVTFYDFPEAHWQHLRTTNLERALRFVTTANRCGQKLQEGGECHRSHLRGLIVAEKRFRRLNAPHLMYAGERYENGSPIEQREKEAA